MRSFNYRFIIQTLGLLLIIEAIFLMSSAIVSFYYEEICGDSLLLSAVITFIVGVLFHVLGTAKREMPIGKRESFTLVSLTWVVLSFFGALPYFISGAIPDFGSAYFESMSGFTTTGATAIDYFEDIPLGILFWRSVSQWIGGVGIVVFALTFLPMAGGSASVLYDAETSSMSGGRIMPRVKQIGFRIWSVYIVITLLLVFLLYLGPMNLYDSVCHALCTVSTGGYSTHQESIAYWNSSYLEYVIIVFMFLGGTNFSLVYMLFRGRPKKLFGDEEFRWYASIILIFAVIITICLMIVGHYTNIEFGFRTALFQVVSTISTTGFTTTDYTLWGPFFAFATCVLMLICGCAGSTSGGIKVSRIMLMCKNVVNELKKQVHPNAVLAVRVNGQVVSHDMLTKVTAFLFIYISILFLSFMALALSGMGFADAMGSAITCISNVGPGLGITSPSGNFDVIPEFAKWYLSFLMMLGRLELFTVLSLFIPSFWKK